MINKKKKLPDGREITDEDFAYQRAWEKHILGYREPLPKDENGKGYLKPTLIAYCFAMASHGTDGLYCYASDKTIAEELGMYRQEDVGRYRRLAKDLGWFTTLIDQKTGKPRRKGRAEILDINIPIAPLTGATKDSADCPPESTVIAPMRGALPSNSLIESYNQEHNGSCTFPRCKAPAGVWHEHMPPELAPTAQERRGAARLCDLP